MVVNWFFWGQAAIWNSCFVCLQTSKAQNWDSSSSYFWHSAEKRLSSLLPTVRNGAEIVKWKQQSDGTHKNEIENKEMTFKELAKQGKASDFDKIYRYCVFDVFFWKIIQQRR